jgi:effector-binding domain-containing protein
MFSIGEFARHGRVSVRMLRHYDAIGLIRPACVDVATGYRFYEASQLDELNRVIALEDEEMTSEPEIVTRPEQPYAAIGVQVTMAELGAVVPPLNREVFAWLGERGTPPAGAPFWKYNVIDMASKLEIEAGVPVAAAVAGDDRVISGVLPAGRYATLTHVGHPSELVAATKALLDWAAEQGLTWDVTPGEDGERWACRLETYLTDPGQQPDMSKWVTQLAFKLAD